MSIVIYMSIVIFQVTTGYVQIDAFEQFCDFGHAKLCTEVTWQRGRALASPEHLGFLKS